MTSSFLNLVLLNLLNVVLFWLSCLFHNSFPDFLCPYIMSPNTGFFSLFFFLTQSTPLASGKLGIPSSHLLAVLWDGAPPYSMEHPARPVVRSFQLIIAYCVCTSLPDSAISNFHRVNLQSAHHGNINTTEIWYNQGFPFFLSFSLSFFFIFGKPVLTFTSTTLNKIFCN